MHTKLFGGRTASSSVQKAGPEGHLGLFSGVTVEDTQKLNVLHRSTPNIQLRAEYKVFPEYRVEHVVEGLVALSWRDSILTIPRILVPNAGRDGYTLFSLDDQGYARKPLPTTKSTAIAFLDWEHLRDDRCKYSKCRWAILKAYRKTPVSMPVYELYSVPENMCDKNTHNIPRSALVLMHTFNSVPVFEVDAMDWYYEEILRRMGSFLDIGHPLPANSMTRYYQYMTMKHGNFVSMYSFDPSSNKAPEFEEPEEHPIMTIRENIVTAPKIEPIVPTAVNTTLTLAEQLKQSAPVATPQKKKIILTRR